jgi:hypothetical protein
MGPVLRGSKFQKDELNKVATKVPGRNINVMAVIVLTFAA